MISKHCIVSKAKGYNHKQCGECYKHTYTLKDHDKIYHLEFNNCIMEIKGQHIERKGLEGLIPIKYL